MQCLEVSGAVRPIYGSLGVKRLSAKLWREELKDAFPNLKNTNMHNRCWENKSPPSFLHILTQHAAAIGQHRTQMHAHSERNYRSIKRFLESVLSATQERSRYVSHEFIRLVWMTTTILMLFIMQFLTSSYSFLLSSSHNTVPPPPPRFLWHGTNFVRFMTLTCVRPIRGPGFEFRQSQESLLFYQSPQSFCGPTIFLFTGYWSSFPGEMRPGREVDLSPPSTEEVRSCTSAPLCMSSGIGQGQVYRLLPLQNVPFIASLSTAAVCGCSGGCRFSVR